jgi:hypothetical protein
MRMVHIPMEKEDKIDQEGKSCWNTIVARPKPTGVSLRQIASVRIYERGLTHVLKLAESIEPNVQQSLPQHVLGEFQNSRPVALIPFVGLRLSLDQNPQALVSVTNSRVRIHERGLIHVVKLIGSVEPNVQQSLHSRVGRFDGNFLVESPKCSE